MRPFLPSVERGVDERRNNHSAESAHDGKHSASRRSELPYQNLPLDLKPNDEEKENHQPVVDPVMQSLIKNEVTNPHGEVRVPQLMIGLLPRGVRPDESYHRADEQHDATGGFQFGESLEGTGDPPYGRAPQSSFRKMGRVVDQGLNLLSLLRPAVSCPRLSASPSCEPAAAREHVLK